MANSTMCPALDPDPDLSRVYHQNLVAIIGEGDPVIVRVYQANEDGDPAGPAMRVFSAPRSGAREAAFQGLRSFLNEVVAAYNRFMDGDEPYALPPLERPLEADAGESAMRGIVSLILALALSSCNDPNANNPNANSGKGPGNVYRAIWTDPETGCQYHFWSGGVPLANNYAMALAPRLGPDGKPMGCGAVEAKP